jgi:hypothetical protein
VANEDRGQMALPKLFGAPAYARPTVPVARADRPFDPDDLPLEAHQTSEDRKVYERIAARPYAGVTGDAVRAGREGSAMMRGRPFRLGAIAAKIRGDRDSSAA